MKKFISIALTALLLFGSTPNVESATTFPDLWRKIGPAIFPIDTSWEICSSTSRCGKIWISALDATTATIGAISLGFTQGSVIFADGSGNADEDNANFFWDDANNRLGIGVNSLTRKLEIQDTTADLWASLVSANTDTAGVLFGDTDGDAVGRIVYDNAVNDLSLWTSSSERVTIDSAGKTGFNNTSPSALIDLIVDDTDNVPAVEINQNDSTNNPQALVVNSSSTGTTAQIDVNSVLATFKSGLFLQSAQAQTSGSALLRARLTNASSTIPVQVIENSGTGDSFVVSNGTNNLLEIDSNGLIIADANDLRTNASGIKIGSDSDISLYSNASKNNLVIQFGNSLTDYLSLREGTNAILEVGNTVVFRYDNSDGIYKFNQSNLSGKGFNLESQNTADAFAFNSTGNGTITIKSPTGFQGRILASKGADIASANNITLGNDGNDFDITGTTTINTISATGWTAGSMVLLHFDSALTVSHNTAGTGASILLDGGVNYSAPANSNFLIRYNGTAWEEVSRTGSLT